MSSQNIIIAGFGGQGILYMGQMLAYAANEAGRNVSWLPSYGPEMRGGTANCMLCIADESINSPLILNPDTLVAMNKPSLIRFQATVKKGGVIIVNKDLVDIPIKRRDVKPVEIFADSIAKNLNNAKAANMVALGAILKVTRIVDFDSVVEVMKIKMTGKKANLIWDNINALEKGFAIAENA